MTLGKGYACVLLLASAVTAWGQSFQGGIRGSVADPQGAVIGEVKVSILDEATNAMRSTLSNASGEYAFSAVLPARYTVTAEAPGFKRFERKRVTVGTQEFVTLDLRLDVGEVTESVMVTEEVPLIESSNASTGQVIDSQKLTDLPNLGRNPFMFSKIAQNVVPAGNPNFNRMQDQSGSSQISIAGGPVRGNNYLLDGVPITDSVNRAVIIPSLEAVQEVKVQANTYDAEMGRTGGGVFNTYLKSGSNAVHGSAFGYMRQTDWLANTYFNNKNGLPRQNQPFRNYGGSIGGPIRIPKVYDGRNRTFFWIAGEAYRQTSAVSNEFAVPTAAEISGDFSHTLAKGGGLQTIYNPLTTRPDGNGGYARTPFDGNIIPTSMLNPIGVAIARTFPAATRAPRYHGDNDIAVASSQFDRADQLTGKFDHQVMGWWHASLSYLHYGSREPGENWFKTVSSPAQWLLGRKVDATQINNILTPSPTMVISIRYGFNRFPNDNYQHSLGFDLATLGFAPGFISGVQRPTFPDLTFDNFSQLGVNNNDYTVFSSKNFMVSVAKYVGRHSIKAGYDYRRLHLDGIAYGDTAGVFTFTDVFTRATPSKATAGTGSDFAALLLGYPTTGEGRIATKLFQYVDYQAGYVHDDIRVTPKLTLNAGVRYEFETGLQAKDNALNVGFDRNVTSPIPVTLAGFAAPKGGLMYAGVNGYPTSTGNPNHNKISPRVGAAYSLNSKTVLRGGYGLFWAPIPYNVQATLGYTQTTPYLASSDGFQTPAGNLSTAFATGLLSPVGNANGLLSGIGQNVSVIDQAHRSPRVHQYSFDVQRELPGAVTVAVGYVGSISHNMVLGTAAVNINQLDPQYLSLGQALNDVVANPFYTAGGPGFIGAKTITRSQLLRPFPQFNQVLLNNVDHNSARYDSLVLKAQKRMSMGLSFVSTFTWSKNYDGSFGGVGNNLNTGGGIQDTYNLDAEYALSTVDTPFRWVTAFTYELPFGKGKMMLASNRWLDYIVGGWSLNTIGTFQTGFPLAIRQNSNNNSGIGGLNQRPNATGISPEVSASFAERLDGWINPAAFTQAPQFTFGNVSRTISMRGPGQANWDASLFKTFNLFENFKAQFRAEALNVMNTPLFRGPETRVGNANFGKITSQANFPRYLQMGVRFYF